MSDVIEVISGRTPTVEISEQPVTVVEVATVPGVRGLSAYEVAVANGFVGTETEWLASLQGAPGDPASNIITSVNSKTGAVTLNAADVGAPSVFNILAYGATGDGTVDDAPAIQAAITAAITAGGGIIWFPAGSYLIDSTIQVYSATNVIFQGQGVLVNGVSNAPMVRFRNSNYCGTHPTLQWIGNWRGGSVGLELDGCLYGDFNIRGDQWPTGMNVICSASAIQNSAYNDLAVDIANGINGLVFDGGTSRFASNNRISRMTWGGAGSGTPVGINFVRNADTNIFRWAAITLNVAGSTAVLYNSAAPTSDMQVYENDFNELVVQSSTSGTIAIKANRTTGNGTRTSFVKLRLAGSSLPTNSFATNSDVQLVNSNDGTTQYLGKNIASGAGAPTALQGLAGTFYLRTDTPTVANQRIYVCTVTGAAGSATWLGIA